MISIFEQVFILFVFALAGYILSKRKLLNNSHTPLLSVLLVNIFLPCNVFKTFAANFNRGYLASHYDIIIASAIILLLLMVIMHGAAKLFDKRKYERNIYEYSLTVPNYGYMGYALAEGVLGEAGLLNAMMFAIPLSLYIYTVSFCKMTKRPLSLKKLLSPVMLAMIFGIPLGLSGIKMPEIAMTVLGKSSACMAPVSMLLTGMVISEFNFGSVLKQKKLYIVTFLRNFFIPIIVGLCLIPFFSPTVVQIAVLMYAMPCGLNTIVFPRLVGEDCSIGAGLAVISNILACISIPLVLSLFNIGG